MMSWIAQTLLASTVLMLVVMAVRPLRRHIGSPWVYALWSLPALRLFLPPLPMLQADEVVAGPYMAGSPDIIDGDLLIAIWLAGAALHFMFHIARYTRFMRHARAHAINGRNHRARLVRYSTAVDGPVAGGVWRRVIFLPADFRHRFDREERRLALAHELMHHRRHDVPVNLFAMLVLSLHWFNPIAHVAHRLFRTDQELACDAQVMASKGHRHRFAYGRALLKASVDVPGELCAFSEYALLKARLRGLAMPSVRPSRVLAGLFVGMGFVTIASAATHRMPSAPKHAGVEEPPANPTPVARTSATTTATTSDKVSIRAESLRMPVAAREQPVQRAPRAEPDLSASERLPSSYVQQRRELGLARGRARYASPAEAAAARGRPLPGSPPFG